MQIYQNEFAVLKYGVLNLFMRPIKYYGLEIHRFKNVKNERDLKAFCVNDFMKGSIINDNVFQR